MEVIMEYKIKENLLNATLQYLAQRPFSEVHTLIVALQTCQKIKEPNQEVETAEVAE